MSARIGRRQLLAGAGAAVAGAAVIGTPGVASAAEPTVLRRAKPLPKPIVHTEPAPPLDPIHWTLPGEPGSATPLLGLPAMGLDVDPSSISDFKGTTAFAVLTGEMIASDGNTNPTELDIRVMEGMYVAEDGSTNRGAFAFV